MKMHHYGLTVSDLEKSLEFYRDTLDLKELHRTKVGSERFSKIVGVDNAEAEISFLDANGVIIELFEYRPTGKRVHGEKQQNNDIGAHHIGFNVEDVNEWYEKHSDSVEFINPPQSGPGANAAYLYDPDGNVVEILESETINYF